MDNEKYQELVLEQLKSLLSIKMEYVSKTFMANSKFQSNNTLVIWLKTISRYS